MKKLIFDVLTREAIEVKLSAAEVAERESASTAEAEAVPDALTPAQFWMQLAIDGDEAAALAIIDTLPRPQQILATKAKDYRIDDPLLLQLAAALGKNESQIDAFFRRAVKL